MCEECVCDCVFHCLLLCVCVCFEASHSVYELREIAKGKNLSDIRRQEIYKSALSAGGLAY